jgi:riboflavin kinase/FMN adenylyltransferase
MEIVRRLATLEAGIPSVATIGKFDGVHQGHRFLINRVKQRAAELGAQSVVITFDPHPLMVLRPDQPYPQLTCLSDKIRLIGALDVNLLLILPFTPQLAAQTPEQFMASLTDHLNLRLLVEGEDFALGRGRAGTPEVLREIGQRLGYEVEILARVQVDGIEVRSSTIRQLLADGNVAAVAPLLGRAPTASGPVVEGARRGRQIGWPTANIAVDEGLALPANGVYAAVATSPELPRPYRAMVNIGTRPTFDNGQRTVEAHLLDFDGDLYGMQLTLHFIARLRDEQRFDGIAALVAQLERDRLAAREHLTDAALVRYAPARPPATVGEE